MDDSHRGIRITLSPLDTGEMALKLERTFYNQEAGFARYQLLGVDMADYKKNLETDYTSQWGVSMTVDSAQHDSIRTIDTLFKEVIYGSVALNVQTVGKTTILTPPTWSTIPKSLLPRLVSDGKREFPIDLRDRAGRYEKTMEINVPSRYGTPRPLDPVAIKDSLFTFTYRSTWDAKTRKLVLTYLVQISDGRCDLNRFMTFARKVIEVTESPLLFERAAGKP